MRNRATVLFLCLNLTALSAQETIARGTKMRGDVKVKSLTSASFSPVKSGAAITSGDVLNVGTESFCMVIYLVDKSVLKIREDTQFQFMDTENKRHCL